MERYFKWLRENWVILGAVFTLIVGGAHADTSIKDHEKRITAIEAIEIKAALAEIKVRQDIQTDQLKEIKGLLAR